MADRAAPHAHTAAHCVISGISVHTQTLTAQNKQVIEGKDYESVAGKS